MKTTNQNQTKIKDWLIQLSKEYANEEYAMPTVKAYFDTLTLANPKHYDILLNLFMRWTVAAVNSGLRRKHNDVMLLLVGPQGTYKTSWLHNLVPPQFRDDLLHHGYITPCPEDRDTARLLAEKWFISMSDTDTSEFVDTPYCCLNNILSTRQVTYRPIYSQEMCKQNRMATFMGDINDYEHQPTHKGILPIRIKQIKASYTNIDIRSLWGEVANIVINQPKKQTT